MKILLVVFLFFLNNLAYSSDFVCEEDSKEALKNFLEYVQFTSVGGGQLQIVSQSQQGNVIRSEVSFEAMGALWSVEVYEVVVQSQGSFCSILGVHFLDKKN